MSDLSLNIPPEGLFHHNNENEIAHRPLAQDCQSIYDLPPLTLNIPYPLDIYNYGKKNKPPTSSFYEKLRDLRDSDRVFVKAATKPIIKNIDLKCQFEVLNDRGVPIYFALDTTDAWASSMFEETRLFNVMILDYDYSEVLKVAGPGVNQLHGSVWVKHCGKDIGRIVQDDHLCTFTPNYSFKGFNEVIGLRVKGPPNSYAIGLPNNPVFDVVWAEDEVLPLGKISKEWLHFGKDKEGLPEQTYVVNFHQNMDLRSKCLMLSLVFVLDYQFYHKEVESGISRRCWMWFIISFFSCVILVYVLLHQMKHLRLGPVKEDNLQGGGPLSSILLNNDGGFGNFSMTSTDEEDFHPS